PFGSNGSIQPTTTFTYDAHQMLHTKVEPRGNVAGGNPASYTWTYDYDNNGQVTAVTAPTVPGPGGVNISPQTQYGYDDAGNLTSLTDQNGHVTRYEYDPNYNLSCVLHPDVAVGVTTCPGT